MTRRASTGYLILGIVNAICFFLIWNSHRAIDYHAFYSAGRLVHQSFSAVYDISAQRSVLNLFDGDSGFLPYYHPPHELLLFALLARLPYKASLLVWELMGAAFLFGTTRLLSIVLQIPWSRVTVFSCALFATGFSFYEGQDTLLLALMLSSALFFLHREQDVAASAVLALALFKPQIPLVVALALLVNGRWRFFRSFGAFSLAIAAISYSCIGAEGFRNWLSIVKLNEPQEQAWRMMSLRGLFSLAHLPHAFDIACSAALMLMFLSGWRRTGNVVLLFSSAIVVGSLVAFHFHAYDGTVLLIPLAYLLVNSKLNWLHHLMMIALCLSPLFFALSMINKSALLCIPVLLFSMKFWGQLQISNPEEFRNTEQFRAG